MSVIYQTRMIITHIFIDKTKDQIIKGHKLYVSKYKINLINPIIFWFIIVSSVCSIKPLSKNITSLCKLFYRKVERYHIKEKVWSRIKTFWTTQNSYPVIPSINKVEKGKAAKIMSAFDFWIFILKYLMTNYCMF